MGTHTITANIFDCHQTCVESFLFEYRDEQGEEYVEMTSSRTRKKTRESNECPGERKPQVGTSKL